MLRSILLSAAALALIPLTGSAAPRVADIFGDRMVLQRDRPVPVWGEAPSGTPVTVDFAGQRKSTIAGADTRWQGGSLRCADLQSLGEAFTRQTMLWLVIKGFTVRNPNIT